MKLYLLASCVLVVASDTYPNFKEETKHDLNSMLVNNGRYHIPSFMVLGTQKGGTSAIYDQIKHHPLVGETKTGFKELGYFTGTNEPSLQEYQQIIINSLKDNVEPFARHSASTFLNISSTLFGEGFRPSEKVFLPVATFDATPGYLYFPSVPVLIKETIPWLSKFVVSLRNPIDRAFSAHRMRKWFYEGFNLTFEEDLNMELQVMMDAGLVPQDTNLFFDTKMEDDENSIEVVRSISANKSFLMPGDFYGSEREFDAWLKYFEVKHLAKPAFGSWGLITRGLYSLQIKRWLQYYDVASFLVLKLEDCMGSTNAIQERANTIVDFLGLPRYDLDPDVLPAGKKDILEVNHYVEQHKSNSAQMKESTRLRLKMLFEPFNRQLSLILGTKWERPW